jgi:hypothetical protein
MQRLLLTFGTFGLAGLGWLGMLRGWRRRQGRQFDLPAPALPSRPVRQVLPGVPGVWVGTTGAGDWLDRVAVHHLSDRAAAEVVVAQDGVHVHRDGLRELYLPLADVTAVSIEQALAGKVMSGGMLVVTWRLGDRLLASAFRADDHAAHAVLRDALLPVEAA